MRVLLCEDAPRLAEAEAEVLRLEGYGVDIAADGERALELASSGAYGCILLDIMLPLRSGLEVLADLRAAGSGEEDFLTSHPRSEWNFSIVRVARL